MRIPAPPAVLLALPLCLGALVACGDDRPGTAPAPVATSSSLPASSAPSSSVPAVLDICSSLTPEAVGQVLGETVTVRKRLEGCGYTSDDPTAPELTVSVRPTSDYPGLIVEARQSLPYVIADGKIITYPHLADGGVIDVGTASGAVQASAVGFVHLGDSMVQVNLRQQQHLTVPQVRAMMKAAVIAVAKAG